MSHFPFLWRTAFLLYSTLQTEPFPCVPLQGHMFGRVAEQSPFTGCDPKAPVEVSSTEVTTLLLPSRKTSTGSTYNSGEEIVTTPAVSEVDERSSLGMLASPLLTKDRDKCNTILILSL